MSNRTGLRMLDVPAQHTILPGGGEMGALIRAHDWAATPLGPAESWPQSLKTAVQMVLASPFPNIVLWGPELVQLYNDGYRALMGVKHPAGLGQPTQECWPEVWSINAPIYERVWQGESLAFEDALYPLTRSGVLEDAWFTLAYSPIRDEAGAVAGVLVTVFDTTDRLRAEAALRESEESYRTLFDSIDEGFCICEMIVDSEGKAIDYRFLQVNPLFGELTGIRPDAVGRTARELVPGLEDHWVETYARVGLGGESLRFEHGSSAMGRWFDVYASPFGEKGNGRLTIVFKDITVRKRAEEERERLLASEQEARQAAENAARMREEFLSTASHELRNPVASIVGTAQLLQRTIDNGKLTEDRLRAYVETLNRTSAHLATLTNDLLDVSQLERGEMPLHPESTDVARLLRDIVGESEWPDHHISLEGGEASLQTIIDVNRIRQVVSNLLENAVKYSPVSDEVEVRLQRDNGGLLIEVQDSGIGLPPDAVDSIFTPFQRAPNASAAGIPGLGLGLFIARRIAEQHGGWLRARSDGDGHGTIMSLWLPLRPTESATGPARGANDA